MCEYATVHSHFDSQSLFVRPIYDRCDFILENFKKSRRRIDRSYESGDSLEQRITRLVKSHKDFVYSLWLFCRRLVIFLKRRENVTHLVTLTIPESVGELEIFSQRHANLLSNTGIISRSIAYADKTDRFLLVLRKNLQVAIKLTKQNYIFYN